MTMPLLTRLFILIVLAASFSSVRAEVDYVVYGNLLETYVARDGVRYEAWFETKADLTQLEDVLASWAKVDVASLSAAEQKAFYINLYNAAMLQVVLKRYPVKSVKSIGLIPFSIFKKDFIIQGDRKLSLDDVEKGILLQEYSDPRIHFAVNCASESCPPLRAEPYVGSKLELQLDEQTRLFANSERSVRLNGGNKRPLYSELFNWYDADFEGAHPAEYLNQYRQVKLSTKTKFDWIPYDWSLNAAN